MRRILSPAVVGSLLLAILSTIADYIWFLQIPRHQVASGAIHGAVLFAALGWYLGWRKGQAGAGALGGLLSGAIAAISFYVLAPFGGYPVMLISWLVLWIMLAALQRYLDGDLNIAKAIGRGITTAIVAAIGFGVVLFRLYRGWPPAEFPALLHFAAWSLAYFPGLHVLLKR